jgi:hypothetical protein
METVAMHKGADLVVKCLGCKNTYEVHDVTVLIEPVLDPDEHTFLHYEVKFGYEGFDGGEVDAFIQDLLCMRVNNTSGRRCSVFGRLPNGSVFAFPMLTKVKPDRLWVSSPDAAGTHYGAKQAKR